MEIAKDKTKAFAIAVFLILSIGASMMLVQTANAQSTKATYAYIGAVPNPVGVNQETLLHLGITDAIGAIGSGWQDLTVTVKTPDGDTETLGPFDTDSTGGTGTVYIPEVAGNYTLQTHFPEQTYGTTVYKASVSNELTLVATEEPLSFYQGHVLPTEYWTRPIDPQLREWYTVAGSWLVSSPTNLFTDPGNDEAPDTAHVLWTKPFTSGGLVGGSVGLESSINEGPVGFETGDAYQGKWSSRFIIAGMLIYTHHTSVRPLEYTAVDIRTGEELWTTTFLNNLSISMCQLFYWESYNYMGTYAYIWVTSGTSWYAFDPFDTQLRINMSNVPSGTTIVGERGEIYRYSISTSARRMTLWNMSALISMAGSFLGPGVSTYNASATYTNGTLTTAAQRAYSLNFTIPEGLPGSTQQVYLNDRVIGATISTTAVRLWAFSLASDNLGSLLYNETWNAPAAWASGNQSLSWMAWSREDKVAVMFSKETCENYAFSLETGKFLWGPTEPEYYLNSLDDTKSAARSIAYGKYYSASVSGIVYCYDVQTGDLLWTYEAKDPYSEIKWADTWWLKPLFVCDGKIYVGHLEHSANQPLPRGAPFICLNATTGEVIFRVDGMFRQTRWGGRAIIGDSVIATMDTYDQSVYAIGKGPSATTVSAGPEVSVEGSSVVVQGMVTDISPGADEYSLTARFPNGVPAVSDANMSEWMLYVYKQFERPADVVGVEVVVSVLDPNNNCYEVGRTTGDASGFFKLSFVPEVPGEYTIIATFEGSGAYYGSFAETAINVEEAPQPTPEPTPTPAPMTDTYVLGIGAAAIIAIVAIGLVIILMLRKR